MSAPAGEADFTLLAEDRLVAYLWRRAEGGHLRRGSGEGALALGAIPYAELHLFDRRREPLLLRLVAESADLEALLFAVQLEGLRVVAGPVTPHPRQGRF